MELQIGTIVGYNNLIIIATENQKLGFNEEINIKHVDLIHNETTEGTLTRKSLPEPKREKVTTKKEEKDGVVNEKDHSEKDHSEKDHSEKDHSEKDHSEINLINKKCSNTYYNTSAYYY
jgi:uncharacterized protein involved in copper resistance